MSEDYVKQLARLQNFGWSYEDAKKHIEKQSIMNAISEARNFYELRALVQTIAEKTL